MNALLRRSVPEARCRVASSVIAVVSSSPGMSTMSPDERGDEHRERADEPREPDRRGADEEGGERLEHAADARVALGEDREQTEPEPEHGGDDDLAPAAAEELADRAGEHAVGERDERRTVRRGRGDDALDARHPLARATRVPCATSSETCSSEASLREVHLARLDAQQVRVLPRLRPERRHDLRRHGEEAMAVQAEPVRRRAEDALETRRGVAVGVQRARELEHEADGERIRLDRARR